MGGYNSYYDTYETYNELFEMLEEMPAEFLMVFAVIMIGAVVVGLALGILVYLFTAIGLSKMGKNRGMTNGYLAFIPIANMYFTGALSDRINAANGKQTNHRVKLLTFGIVNWALSMVDLIYSLRVMFMGPSADVLGDLYSILSLCSAAFSIVYAVFYFIALYNIFKEYSPNCAVAFLVLSILFSIVTPFFIFAIRNKVGTSQQPKYYYQQPPYYPQQY